MQQRGRWGDGDHSGGVAIVDDGCQSSAMIKGAVFVGRGVNILEELAEHLAGLNMVGRWVAPGVLGQRRS